MEDSKNATNHFLRREDISFDSNQQPFSQTGTPNQFKVKLPGANGPVKKINIVGREVIQQKAVVPTVLNATASVERKPKKIMLPHTTGALSQAPSP